ncbi:MAG: hypothetical protein KKA84_08795 [Bacteroidetes bacterium]|nr:hypothetical protein [Bacteroidota bacterium]
MQTSSLNCCAIVFLLMICIVIETEGQSTNLFLSKNSVPDSTIVEESNASINELKQVLNLQRLYDPFKHNMTNYKNLFTNGAIADISPGLNFTPGNIPSENFEMGRQNLKNSIQMQTNFMGANDLGVFGDILLYTNFAAAGYVLYQHLKKYKDEY